MGEPGQYRNLVFVASVRGVEVAKDYTKFDLKRKLRALGYDVDGL